MTLPAKRKRAKSKWKYLSCELPPELYDKAVRMAEKEYCSCAAVMRRLLADAPEPRPEHTYTAMTAEQVSAAKERLRQAMANAKAKLARDMEAARAK